MRDVIFKAITSQDHKKREILFKEAVEDNGVSAKIEKSFTYQIKSISPFNGLSDLSGCNEISAEIENKDILPQLGNEKQPALKNLSVSRIHNSKTGKDSFEYKAIGDLFVVYQGKIFAIEFSYFFSIVSIAMQLEKEN